MNMGISMDGFRRRMVSNVESLKQLILHQTNDQFVSNDELTESMNDVVRDVNILISIQNPDDETFNFMPELEIELLEEQEDDL